MGGKYYPGFKNPLIYLEYVKTTKFPKGVVCLSVYLSSLNVKQICLLKKLGKYKKAREQIKLTHDPDTNTVYVSLSVC